MHTHQVDEAVHTWFPSLQFHQQTNGLASHHDKGVDLQSHPRTQNKILVLSKITHASYMQNSGTLEDSIPTSHAALNLGWPGRWWAGGVAAISKALTDVDGKHLHLGTTHNNYCGSNRRVDGFWSVCWWACSMHPVSHSPQTDSLQDIWQLLHMCYECSAVTWDKKGTSIF